MNVHIIVDGRGLDAALRAFKKARDKAGVTRELKRRQSYLPPSVERRQKQKRARKREEKRALLRHEAGAREQPQGRRLTRQIRKARGREKR